MSEVKVKLMIVHWS